MDDKKKELTETSKKDEANMSERFTDMVIKEFGTKVAPLEFTEKMKSLIMGYFISIDRALKIAEEARLRKSDGNRDPIPVIWANVNLEDLALDVMHYAKVGLDMSLENYLFAIPYKNNKTGKYDVTLMEGYNGKQYISERYALSLPEAVTIELVYSNDVFEPIKKSKDNHIDSYTFDIPKPFDRGSVVGGFGYIEYDDPRRNKLITMTLAQIEKRKPKYAAPEFWGGEKDEWANGQKTGQKVKVDGWFEEMCLKTMKREVFSAKHMPRDPDKIDEHYRHIRKREADTIQAASQAAQDIYGDAPELTMETPPALPAGMNATAGGTLSNGNTIPDKSTIVEGMDF